VACQRPAGCRPITTRLSTVSSTLVFPSMRRRAWFRAYPPMVLIPPGQPYRLPMRLGPRPLLSWQSQCKLYQLAAALDAIAIPAF